MKLNALVLVILLGSCSSNEYKKKHNKIWYLNNTDPMKNAWIKADTLYFNNYINELEKESNKNIFYSNLTAFYSLSGRVIIAFNDSCQEEKHHIFNDLVIDSVKEIMNKTNAINGLKTYMNSELLFNCNLNSDTLEEILNSNWKQCELMNEKDFERISYRFYKYAQTLQKCDTCTISFLDSTITYIRIYKKYCIMGAKHI